MGSLAQVIMVEDCFGILQLYSDGSIYRAKECDIIKVGDHIINNKHDEDEDEDYGCNVEWEDCLFEEQHKLYLRLYKPINKVTNCTRPRGKLKIIYYIHGGGFCLGSRTWPNCHNFCLQLSFQLQALVISPDYRLAPEHRLPAAIEDGLNAIKWLQLQAKLRKEPAHVKDYYAHTRSRLLLDDHDDDGVGFDKVFLMGDSSGGNIAHHLAVHLGSGSLDISPVRVNGYVLLAPFFGGSLRTNSEAEDPEPTLKLDTLDRFWRLSLPGGETRDHPFANPFGPRSPNLEMISLDPILVIVGGNEIMKDRVKDYAKRLKDMGKEITYAEFKGEYHGFFTNNPCSDVSNQVLQLIKQFTFTRETSY